jgi:uncharacterized delta-60 repeat protein
VRHAVNRIAGSLWIVLLVTMTSLMGGCPNPTTQVATPTFNPAPDTYGDDQSVTISCATYGAAIYYTTDGTDPTSSGTAYSGAISVAGDGTTVTIKAVGVMSGVADSAVASASYTIQYQGLEGTPVFSPAAGVYNADQTVTISYPVYGENTHIHYTTDGTAPTSSSPVYSGPISVAGDGTTVTIKAMASANNRRDSGVAEATYTIDYSGNLDAEFLSTGVGANSYVNSIALQGDGRILIGGGFISYNGKIRERVARLNADGSLDTTFLNTGSGANNSVLSIAVQTDGKILIGGYFTTYNGTSRGHVARLNADGSLDETFLNTGSGASYSVYTVAIQNDGKILMGGYFTYYNDVIRGYVARLNADGSLDTGFLGNGDFGANSSVKSIVIQNDNKILIGGDFIDYSGTSRGHVARLNADGSLDTTFLNTGSGANNSVLSIGIKTDGKILIGGFFTTYNGTSRGHVARLNADGSLDTGFHASGDGASDSVVSLAIQGDGKIMIGGGFTAYDKIPRGHIARLLD